MSTFLAEHGRTFGRSQITAMAATAADYSTMVALVELAGFDYRVAVAAGALAGAVLNFCANRAWAFGSEAPTIASMIRYALVSGGSLGLNVACVWLVTEGTGVPYYLTKIAVAVVIGLGWNYPLHKYWVFPAARHSAAAREEMSHA